MVKILHASGVNTALAGKAKHASFILLTGYTNLFLSPAFAEVFSAVTGARVELFQTDGSQGAARGAGIGAGIYKNIPEAFIGLKTERTIEPDSQLGRRYREIYQNWVGILERELGKA